ncbi:MAG: lectin like domain-containing protein [Clostridiales bacterium]|nr:lectin like domain-containing protein [Clostridiales bacterium]
MSKWKKFLCIVGLLVMIAGILCGCSKIGRMIGLTGITENASAESSIILEEEDLPADASQGGSQAGRESRSEEPAATMETTEKATTKVDETDQTASGNPLEKSGGTDNESNLGIPLPSHYDGRSEGRAARVRDQGELGTCWAFASLSAIESRLLPEEIWDFSEDHMSHDPNFLLGQTGGGEYTMAMAYLLSWRGPVTEEEDPYGDDFSPEDLTAAKHVQEIQILPDGDLEAIKRAVLQWGGVESSLYIDLKNASDASDFYNPETAAYCVPAESIPNHDITIVGWDDDFSREAFAGGVTSDGAFLCENSWGTEFGEDGFFYVSYEDRTIGLNNIVYTVIESTDHYTDLYQSDQCGWVGQLGYGAETAWAANVYQTEKETEIAAAGFYAIDRDTEYEVYVVQQVPDKVDGESLQKREKVADGRLTYAGYYTIPFAETIDLNAGERFAVMICLTTPGAVHPIAIEYDAGDGKCRIDLTDGEGYASPDGVSWERVEESQKCNLCLKAYGK